LNKTNVPGLALRLQAAERLSDVLKGGDFAPFAVSEIADGRDRALANRLVTTALRRHGQIDVIMGRLLERGLPKKAGNFEAILRLSLAQLLFLPDLGAHSAIFLAGEAIKSDQKSRHVAGLMNAVLRSAQRQAESFTVLPPGALLPQEVGERWSATYGVDTTLRFAELLTETPPLDLTVKTPTAEQAAALGGELLGADTVRIISRDKPVNELPGYAEGDWWVQDAAAAIPARLVNLPAGARVLDMCAAPGGKTAQLVKAGYSVTALDNDAPRLERLGSNLQRLGYQAETVLADGTSWTPEAGFDGVLLDAPCTATGTFRRHPEVLWHRGVNDIKSRAGLQRRFIANAIRCLNPGGVLLYCVCSLEPEEGEAQAAWIAGDVADLVADPIRADEIAYLPEAVRADGTVRTHPGLALGHGTAVRGGGLDGFFIARYRKR
jgi:16S rRNA (cytosine967-C5)-methyltransferase